LEQCDSERQTLEQNLNDITMSINQFKDRLAMLKEEKTVINKDIVNLISYKESYEEIVNTLSFDYMTEKDQE